MPGKLVPSIRSAPRPPRISISRDFYPRRRPDKGWPRSARGVVAGVRGEKFHLSSHEEIKRASFGRRESERLSFSFSKRGRNFIKSPNERSRIPWARDFVKDGEAALADEIRPRPSARPDHDADDLNDAGHRERRKGTWKLKAVRQP